jgi:hypothetical protein
VTDPEAQPGAPVLALTDEELLVLTGGDGPVVFPFLAGLPPAELEVAVQTARRSLLARNVLVPDDPTVLAGAPLGALLELREGAPVVVVMHRVAGAPDDAPPGEEVPHGLSRYLHVVESVVLSEDVTPAGVHTFGLAPATALEQLLRDFLVPADAPTGVPEEAGPVRPSEDDPLPAALGGPTVLVEAAVLHAAAQRPGDLITATFSPSGCFLGRTDDDTEPPLLEPVAAPEVVAEVLAEAHRAVRAVEEALAHRG